MILINVKFRPLEEYQDNFMEKVAEFTEASRAEEGCLFFDWYRSTEDEGLYILIEAFQDDAAEAHVNSQHFKDSQELFPTLLKETPEIINTLIPGKTGWDEMAEFQVK
ncbi:putative quinol monooxygenase [Corynebacterium guangdongense]|uniref:Quinol monooxygenase YgiN n=1 Tax=Corynebacterium guangdongense TaxID=1783348 RepID=A0ABU1ZVB3_9CORY|nr:putative quinol monooxygenase [Corynebacterium guangdongense]MDR7328866.1 quinol monooxygenase YgiN [Corynebacterium guangdongense]WJZ17441.1 Antibiotic biosynthesis monooxygenase [Corynebacterium guangdongense]